MMPKVSIKDHEALPRPSAPCAHVVRSGNLVFVSGVVGRDKDGKVVRGDVQAQFRQALENMRIALEAVWAKPAHVVRVTLYMIDIREKALLDRLREEFFRPEWPAAAAIGVTALAHPDYRVEMDAIAVVE
jgi:2-iminobutanoate/2-iminopropanoate deaminase